MNYQRQTIDYRLLISNEVSRLSIKYGNLPNFFCKAIVDTGCPFTIISESSIKKTRIPYNSKKSFKYNVQIGNISMELKELGMCEINFRDDENKTKAFEQELYVGIPLTRGYLSQELPSFIGKDCLDKHSISIINKKDGKNYLLVDD